jgi:hypothetical protein
MGASSSVRVMDRSSSFVDVVDVPREFFERSLALAGRALVARDQQLHEDHRTAWLIQVHFRPPGPYDTGARVSYSGLPTERRSKLEA